MTYLEPEYYYEFVRALAWKKVYGNPYVEFDDVSQEGMIGLLNGIKKVKQHYNKKQTISYIKIRIYGAIMDYIRIQASKGFTKTNQRRTKILPNINYFNDPIYPQFKNNPYSYPTLGDTFGEEYVIQTKIFITQAFTKILKTLPMRTAIILKMYTIYGYTFDEIGEKIGLTGSRIFQIISPIIKKFEYTL